MLQYGPIYFTTGFAARVRIKIKWGGGGDGGGRSRRFVISFSTGLIGVT